VFGLYLKRVFAPAAFASILLGEAALACFHFKWVSPAPFLPVVWVMLAAFGAYLAVHAAFSLREGQAGLHVPGWITERDFLMSAGIFALSMDFWAWDAVGPVVLGIPVWIAYFMLLSILQTALMGRMIRKNYA
jgi:hypothetical protein